MKSTASFHYGNWRALHLFTVLLADCVTRSFCTPVSMVKDAMESIYMASS